jgi:hypothetical protein
MGPANGLKPGKIAWQWEAGEEGELETPILLHANRGRDNETPHYSSEDGK